MGVRMGERAGDCLPRLRQRRSGRRAAGPIAACLTRGDTRGRGRNDIARNRTPRRAFDRADEATTVAERDVRRHIAQLSKHARQHAAIVRGDSAEIVEVDEQNEWSPRNSTSASITPARHRPFISDEQILRRHVRVMQPFTP